MRRAIGSVALIAVLAGCRSAVPDSAASLKLLEGWQMTAQLGRDGSVVTATYEGWPLPTAPRVFACAEEPDEVFAGPPTFILAIEADPGCREFTTRLDGRRLRLSLDQTTMPAAFVGLDVWHVAFAVGLDGRTWSAETVMPVEWSLPRPAGS